MSDSRDTGVARILKADRFTPAGMAMVIGGKHVLTCAHVINDSLERPRTSDNMPDDDVCVGFPIGNHTPVSGRVIEWRLRGEIDLAIVELGASVPVGVGVAVLTQIENSAHDSSLSIYGPSSGQRGAHEEVKALLVGPANRQEIQIRVTHRKFLVPGSSGSAVWDGAHRAAIGIVRSRDEFGGPEAYMLPATAVAKELPGIPVEKRTVSSTELRWWARLTSFHFASTVFLFGATLSWHNFVAKNLAAFCGALLYIIASVTGWMFARYARQFRAHPWSTRTPVTSNLTIPAGSGSERILAMLAIIFLVLFPAYAQCRFWLVFDDPGHVYIYPRDFGYTPEALIAKGRPCSGRASSNNRLCGHKEADLWSVVTPINNAEGGFFNNRYQYGDINGEENHTAMFYPILEPGLIILSSVVGFTLNLYALCLVFRSPARFEPRGKKVRAGT